MTCRSSALLLLLLAGCSVPPEIACQSTRAEGHLEPDRGWWDYQIAEVTPGKAIYDPGPEWPGDPLEVHCPRPAIDTRAELECRVVIPSLDAPLWDDTLRCQTP